MGLSHWVQFVLAHFPIVSNQARANRVHLGTVRRRLDYSAPDLCGFVKSSGTGGGRGLAPSGLLSANIVRTRVRGVLRQSEDGI